MTGSLVTILSPKGGTGKTALAANLALVLAREDETRVCLVDLDLASGDVAASLGLLAGRRFMGAARADGHLVGAELPALLTPYRAGLDCVLAPTMPGEWTKVPAHFIADLLTGLRDCYDYVVVDTPSRLSTHWMTAVDLSDHQVLLTTPQTSPVAMTRRCLDTLQQLGKAPSESSVLVSQSDLQGALSPAEIEEILRRGLAGWLPASTDMLASLNAQHPLALTHPQSPYIASVRAFTKDNLFPANTSPRGPVTRRRFEAPLRWTRDPPG